MTKKFEKIQECLYQLQFSIFERIFILCEKTEESWS